MWKEAIFPADAPKISVIIWFPDGEPYFYTLDGKPVVEHAVIAGQTLSDEIVIEITKADGVYDAQGGERGNKFPYKSVQYEGVAIENLTNPDRKFEKYEY